MVEGNAAEAQDGATVLLTAAGARRPVQPA